MQISVTLCIWVYHNQYLLETRVHKSSANLYVLLPNPYQSTGNAVPNDSFTMSWKNFEYTVSI